MTRIAKLHAQVLAGRALSFAELKRLVVAFGFRLERVSESHHIFRHPEAGILNLQPVGKSAKPYQVRQFRDMIEQHRLKAPDA